MKQFIILVFFLASAAGYGQRPTNQSADSLGLFVVPDSLKRPYVVQDPKIDWLIGAHIHRAKEQRGIPGFRVQIYMDAGNQARLKTQRSRAEFEKKYPDVNAYIVYEEPNFKLRVGDFRTRLDARHFLEKLKKDYPGAYIVLDLIQFPPLD